jgi:hypothetical protein
MDPEPHIAFGSFRLALEPGQARTARFAVRTYWR